MLWTVKLSWKEQECSFQRPDGRDLFLLPQHTPIGTIIGISEAADPSSSGMPVLVCAAQIHRER